jgi:hypothetical protein
VSSLCADLHGRKFTTESAQKAKEAWQELDSKIRRMQSKVNREILVRSFLGAWKSLKVGRGLNIEEEGKTKKRNLL